MKYGNLAQKSDTPYSIRKKNENVYYAISGWSSPYTLTDKSNPEVRIGIGNKNFTRLIYIKFNDEKPVLLL